MLLLAIFLIQICFAAESTMTTFVWQTTGCPSGYNFCGTMEFCSRGSAFGYKQAGTTTCLSPGPVIRLTPGNSYHFTLANRVSGSHTNLHTHGLHVPGSGNSDDVTRIVNFGECLGYNWTLPLPFMGGTYWYHAHHHGVTSGQVSGGALGMLVVNDDLAATTSDANIQQFLTNEKLVMYSLQGSTKNANGIVITKSTTAQFDLINGKWYRFRFALSNPSGQGGSVTVGTGCVAHIIANDGVYLWKIPRSTVPSINGASRVDLAVKCTASSTLKMGTTTVATLTVISGTAGTGTPFSSTGGTWSYLTRPNTLVDLRGVTPTRARYAVQMTAAQINGQSWNANVPLARSVALGDVEEWAISGTGAHPFHLHVYHQQVISGCSPHIVGEFYDTIASSSTCVVRFKAVDYGQRVVLHCHVLSHEDNGAMTWLNVTGGPVQPISNPPVAAFPC